MRIPGVFWVAIILGLNAALPVALQAVAPALPSWVSPVAIMALDVIALAVKIAWPQQAAEVEAQARGAETLKQPEPAWKKVVFGA